MPRHVSRASLALLAACLGGPSAPKSTGRAQLFVGGDISALERIEQAGGVFRDSSQPGDAIAILRTHGANGFRLRIFVHPNGSEVQVNDLAYTLHMAKRVKTAGAKLLLDFHYSDTWADPGRQTTPAAWAKLGFDSLARAVETYTADVIAQLQQEGALPDIVQVGNEIDHGMLWPTGAIGVAGTDTLLEWEHFTGLLKAGIRGVRATLAPGDSVRIMLHYSGGGNAAGTRWFFDHMNRHGVPYDLIGLSYYPWWHGFATNTAPMTWPISRAGQAMFMGDVRAAVVGTPNGRGAGVVWWYPEAIPVAGLYVWAGGSLALFDSTGNALQAIAVMSAR